jgi:hypothetical protein
VPFHAPRAQKPVERVPYQPYRATEAAACVRVGAWADRRAHEGSATDLGKFAPM